MRQPRFRAGISIHSHLASPCSLAGVCGSADSQDRYGMGLSTAISHSFDFNKFTARKKHKTPTITLATITAICPVSDIFANLTIIRQELSDPLTNAWQSIAGKIDPLRQPTKP